MVVNSMPSKIAVGALAVALLALPYSGASDFYLSYLYTIFFWITLATSWGVLSGYAGYWSFGHAAFFGAGVYTSAGLAAKLGPSVFRELPTIVPDASSDLVLLYEVGDLSLPHVAAQLCDFRTDLIDAASRLHTRADVTWAPLVS